MANNKVLFKTEVRKVRDIRNTLSISCRINGTQVILGENNQRELEKVVKLLSEASNILESIR